MCDPRPIAVYLVAAATIALALPACQPGESVEGADEEGAEQVDQPTEAAPSEVPDEAALRAMLQPPSADSFAQSCVADEDCRVIQPSDWSADVSCCYEYGCGLDYEAVNEETWALIRAWREVHAFDCAAHAQDHGPCNNRPIQCGTSQEPPGAVCTDSVCRVAYPTPWPQVAADAQTCNLDADCVAYRDGFYLLEAPCCTTCGGDWLAISTDTRDEIDAWQAQNVGDCDVDACTVCGGNGPPMIGCVAGSCRPR